jgi:hypothetical protein
MYPWSGLLIASVNDPNLRLQELEWSPGVSKGYATDVGGSSTNWLECAVRSTSSSELLVFGILQHSIDELNVLTKVSLNGNWIAELNYSPEEDRSCFKSHDSLSLAARILRCRSEDIADVVTTKINEINALISLESWPNPVWIDVLSAPEAAHENFIFHYKSGSNYLPWATDQYNIDKTKKMNEQFPFLGVSD